MARPRTREDRRVVILDLPAALFPDGAVAQYFLGSRRRRRQFLSGIACRHHRLPGVPASGGALVPLFRKALLGLSQALPARAFNCGDAGRLALISCAVQSARISSATDIAARRTER